MQAKLILKEISKNFHDNKDKYSVHRKLTGHFEQLCQDKNFLHDAIRDCLSKKNFLDLKTLEHKNTTDF